MKKYYIYFFFLATLYSCIEPLSVNIDGAGSNLLVVEGFIHTGEGPYGITLTRSASYGKLVSLESGAQVSIRDDQGEVEFLEEVRDGVYRTSDSYRPEVGRSYILQIQTSDGTRYNSTPEKLEPVAEIDSLFALDVTEPTDNPLITDVGLKVYSRFIDDPTAANYYLWSYTGHFQVNARPDLHYEDGFPAPKDCCVTC